MHRNLFKPLIIVGTSLLLAGGSFADLQARVKTIIMDPPKSLPVLEPVPRPDIVFVIDSLRPKLNKNITPIVDFIRDIEFSDMPEEYDIWSDSQINPYKVDLKDMKDTVKLDLSGYVPPITKHVTSDFGFRRWRFHYGIDLKVEKGDSVLCAFDGTVRLTRRDRRGYGYFVLVRHFNGLETLYGHLARITVNPGDTIKAGVPVGLGGNTGRSTGYHLHFELRYLGNPLNPNDLIDFQSCCTKNNILQLNASHFSYKKEIDKIRFWKVRRGDTLGRIAKRTGVSISKLCKINGIKRSTKLRVGRNLRYT
ncbi:MAG: M23 family metallopeptidase [Bacteroidales bacterium]